MDVSLLYVGAVVELDTPIRLELCPNCTNIAMIVGINYRTPTGIPMIAVQWLDTHLIEDVTHTEIVRIIRSVAITRRAYTQE